MQFNETPLLRTVGFSLSSNCLTENSTTCDRDFAILRGALAHLAKLKYWDNGHMPVSVYDGGKHFREEMAWVRFLFPK